VPVILALDPGERRTGVAISDPTATIASPLQTHDRRRDGSLLRLLRELCAHHGVDLVLVGHPLEAGGERGRSAAHAEALAEKLREALPVTVELVDERFSSKSADQVLRGSGRPKEDRDAVAAAMILQEHLDARGRA